MSKYRWINDDVKIDFPVSKLLQNTMEDAEAADLENNYEYFGLASAIDVVCKGLFARGKLTEEQWNTVCNRYPES